MSISCNCIFNETGFLIVFDPPYGVAQKGIKQVSQ